MFPREGEVGVDSEPPKALMERLEAYFDAVFDYAGLS
jgi:hypothetical protein